MPTLPMVGWVWRNIIVSLNRDKVAYLEAETAGYNMVNVGVAYAGKLCQQTRLSCVF